MHIIWVNDHADFTGGCERYIADTVMQLKQMGVQSTLLFKVGCPHSPAFTSLFDNCFPVVDIDIQIPALDADVVYVNSVEDTETIKKITQINVPSVRFFHDQKAFCLREHKYTAIGHKTCNRKVSNACYSCLGFIRPGKNSIFPRIKTVKQQQQEISVNFNFDQFVVGSNFMKEELIKHGFESSKITVASLFSNEQGESQDCKKPSIAKHTMTHPLQLLFVGQLVRGKGLDTLIEAMSLCEEDYQLVVCGNGKMEPDYKAQALKYGISSRVHFMGQLSQNELKKQYKKSAVVVIPARAPETFCLVGLESLLNGTPVIASNVGGMSEWFKPGFNGLEFKSNDATELASQLRNLMTNKSLQLQLRQNIAGDNYDKFNPIFHTTTLRKVFEKMTEAS